MSEIETRLSHLTLAQKVQLVSGASLWRTHVITDTDDETVVPALKVSDGPNGVRGDGGTRSASFPVGSALAATWNPDLLRRLGGVLAAEAKQKDVQVVLGPTINIHRSPLGGRHFECYSEDPYLSGELAAALVDGLQEQGVAACLKHFVCNDSEFERHSISSEVDERTLREIYLRPFEIAVTKAKPWTVMSAYNRINGVFASAHHRLLNDVLREEWGFDGLVMSDWFGTNGCVESAIGGLDLEMPGPARVWGDALEQAVRIGAVPEAAIDDKVRRLLLLLERTNRLAPGASPTAQPEAGEDTPDHRRFAYQTAVESMVLLKNDGLLPLAGEHLRHLAVIGPNVHNFRIMGGGSSAVAPHAVVSPVDGLAERLPNRRISTAPGAVTYKYVPAPPRDTLAPAVDANDAVGFRLQCWPTSDTTAAPAVDRLVTRASVFFNPLPNTREAAHAARLSGVYRAERDGEYEFGVMATGRSRIIVDGETLVDNWTETTRGDAFFGNATAERRATRALRAGQLADVVIEFERDAARDQTVSLYGLQYGITALPDKDLLAEAVATAREADAVVLIVGTSDEWETEGNDRESMDLPGNQDALVAAVCAANAHTVVVLNTGSPITMPWLGVAPAVLQAWFGGEEFGTALADLITGAANPSGRLATTFPARYVDNPTIGNYPGAFGQVRYGEGIFVGYRWYDRRDIAPLFAFGHGLSYSPFVYSDLAITPQQVTVTVTNIGVQDGAEVVQVYLRPAAGTTTACEFAPQTLKGFAKQWVAAGESIRVAVRLDDRAWHYWHVGEAAWQLNSGWYDVAVGASSRDIRLHGSIRIPTTL